MAEKEKTYTMRILADENIPFVKDAFSTFGDVRLVSGRKISSADLFSTEMLLIRSVTPVTRELLTGTPVKFVATATIGIDHIDLDYLRKHDIAFAYAPGSNANSVAEYVIASLCVLKKKYRLSLEKMTIGIIGVGNIGSKIDRYARALGMRTLLCDPPRKRLTGDSTFLSFQEVISQADIVTFHVPLSTTGVDRTVHMVDDAFFTRSKKNVIIINTSRGKVVDEHSVLKHRQKIGGMVLDVWNNEPLIDIELLAAADIATPHIAGYSYDGKVRGTEAIYNAACVFSTKTPSWSSEDILNAEKISLSGAITDPDPIASIVLQAYPILRDDERMRKIITVDMPMRAAYFDEMRKNYYRRMEFSHYLLDNDACIPESKMQLQRLGFTQII